MIKTLGVVGVAALLVTPAVRSVIPASSHGSYGKRIGVVMVRGAQAAKVPSIGIAGTGLAAHFKPDAVSAELSSPSEPCTAADESMTVTNRSSLDQDMIEGGSDFVNLPPGSTAAICLYSNGTNTFAFALANATATHTLSVAVN